MSSEMSYKEIAREMKIKEEEAKEIERKALEKLRNNPDIKKLVDALLNP